MNQHVSNFVLLLAGHFATVFTGQATAGDPERTCDDKPLTISYEVEGIEQKVTDYGDGYGVPHIRAATDQDAAFGLGFVHARDRFFQPCR